MTMDTIQAQLVVGRAQKQQETFYSNIPRPEC